MGIDYKFARFISYVFHPLFMPTIGLLIIYWSASLEGFNPYVSDYNRDIIREVFLLVIFFTFFIPALWVFISKKKGWVSNYHMELQHERNVPFIITSASYIVCCFIFAKYYRGLVPPLLVFIMFGACIGVIAAFMNNLFWKVSIHMMGIGGVCGMIFTLDQLYENDYALLTYALVLLAGLVGYSRLTLKAHSFSQVIGGFVIGVASETLFLLL